ncbi:MAG: hypothetical protein C5B54_01340 [Acidobacteria bacterium]|nr:MAG: hypothetical protein C5B54_01340 [Acidobacteriota bacterium]
MRKTLILIAFSCAVLFAASVFTAETTKPPIAKWQISGDLTEACSCGVPCTCNFGQQPSPEEHCWALASLAIVKGKYEGINLDGLHLAVGTAKNGTVWYIDDKATPAQFDALKAMSDHMKSKLVSFWKGVDPKVIEDPQFKVLAVKRAPITQQVGDKGNELQIGTFGGFESDYLIGLDGKTPIVLLNNWSWNLAQSIKGKTKHLYYKDEYGNSFDLKDTNANQGKFDWNDQTPIYFR